jgi:hypothetical protein
MEQFLVQSRTTRIPLRIPPRSFLSLPPHLTVPFPFLPLQLSCLAPSPQPNPSTATMMISTVDMPYPNHLTWWYTPLLHQTTRPASLCQGSAETGKTSLWTTNALLHSIGLYSRKSGFHFLRIKFTTFIPFQAEKYKTRGLCISRFPNLGAGNVPGCSA